MTEDYSRNPTTKLLKEIQEAKKHIPHFQDQLNKAAGQVHTVHTQVFQSTVSYLNSFKFIVSKKDN